MDNRFRPSGSLAPLLAFTLVWLLHGERPVFAQHNCLPTCSVEDARFIVVPGGTGAGTFGRNDVSLRLMVPAGAPLLQIEIFDGDTGATDPSGTRHWDSGSIPLQYELHSDPD